MRYKELSARMAAAGWLSHIIAACNTNYQPGTKQKFFTSALLSDTRTGQAFLLSKPVPRFHSESAALATVSFSDEDGLHNAEVSIDWTAGLIARFDSRQQKFLVGFLFDIPSDRIISPPASVSSAPPLQNPESEDMASLEGAASIRQHLVRERDATIALRKRRQVLASTGRLACVACGFDFEHFYGKVGALFCEVHHLRPLGDAEGDVETRLDDLVVVCANCHRMLHRNRPLLTV